LHDLLIKLPNLWLLLYGDLTLLSYYTSRDHVSLYHAYSSRYNNHINPRKQIIMNIILIIGQLIPGWEKLIKSICVHVYNGQIWWNWNFGST